MVELPRQVRRYLTMVELTRQEAGAVAEFIADNLCRAIREDSSIDNVDWIADIAIAYRKLLTIQPEEINMSDDKIALSMDQDSDW